MIPVDMRPYFSARAFTNFSDGVLIPCTPEEAALPLDERAKKMKEFIKAQLTRNYFAHTIAGKTAAVRGFEESGTPVGELAMQKTALPPADVWRPLSYAMTYPGTITFGAGLDRMAEEYFFSMWTRGNVVGVYAAKGELRIRVLTRTDNGIWAGAIYEKLKEQGFDVKRKDLGHVTGSKMRTGELKTVV